ncbi:MAG: hypothetical protein HY291_04070 [Planctomycetes bacterium]|nr:hypothetical protein [Planctomycetota bacterium]
MNFVALGGALALLLLGFPLVRAIRKRERPRFSIAWLLAFVVVLSIGLYGGVKWWTFDPEEAEWQARLDQVLTKKLLEENNSGDLRLFNISLLTSSEIHVFINPSLDDFESKSHITLSNLSLREALNAMCTSNGLEWEACNEAIYIKKKEDPDPQHLPIVTQEWEREIMRRLNRRGSFEDIDVPLTGEVEYICTLPGIKFAFAPELLNSPIKPLQFCPIQNMRLYNALTWICYLGDAEWSLKPTPDGKGMVWIEPRKKKPNP